MAFHAARKSILEIEFEGEEGTGLGPTLEFYALIAAELQRKSLALWLCDDTDQAEAALEVSMDLGEGEKAPGFYVRVPAGLFPAPYPQTDAACDVAASYMWFLGVFLAKVVQDGRLVDLPLSLPLLKLLATPSLSPLCTANEDGRPWVVSEGRSSGWGWGILDWTDVEALYPHRAPFWAQLKQMLETGSETLADGTRLEDLGITFHLNPPSSVFGFDGVDLLPNGGNVDLTADNAAEWLALSLDFCLGAGIARQIAALRAGFAAVFPISKLAAFTPPEIQTLLSGERSPEWSREDILAYTEPKLGYSRDSLGFLRLVDVLVDMSGEERRRFLQFTTGCGSLPPGGLANLHPRLTVVRKGDEGCADGSFPSVNTCLHYLKLPAYSTKEILRERLAAATMEKGFHLN